MNLTNILYFIKRFTINSLSFVCDLFISIHPTKKNGNPTILIIKMDAIGDFFVWLSVAHKYKSLFPKDKFNLVLLTNPSCVELAHKTGFFTLVKCIKRKKFMLNFWYRRQELIKLGQIEYETAIYHANSREFASGDSIIKKITAYQKIGILSDHAIDHQFWTKVSDKWYSQLCNLNNYNQEFIKNSNFLEFLGSKKEHLNISKIELFNHVVTKQNYVIIATGARVKIRKWDVQNFIEVINFVIKNTSFDIILTGALEEIEDGKIIESYFGSHRIINKICKTSVITLCELVSNAFFVVANETAIVHIAAAVQTKSICILGGGHYGRFVPYPDEIKSEFKPIPVFEKMECYYCDWRCKYQVNSKNAAPCISNISVNAVISQIKLLIQI